MWIMIPVESAPVRYPSFPRKNDRKVTVEISRTPPILHRYSWYNLFLLFFCLVFQDVFCWGRCFFSQGSQWCFIPPEAEAWSNFQGSKDKPSTKRVLGNTPAPTTTQSAGKTSPSSNSTPFTASFPRNKRTWEVPNHSTPAQQIGGIESWEG